MPNERSSSPCVCRIRLSSSRSSAAISILFRRKTIFFSQLSFINLMSFASLPVTARSAPIVKKTMSALGMYSCVSRSCCAMVTLVPGVSTIKSPFSLSWGTDMTRHPFSTLSSLRSPYFMTVISSVVGVMPLGSTSCPRRAFITDDLPVLNSPMKTRENRFSRPSSTDLSLLSSSLLESSFISARSDCRRSFSSSTTFEYFSSSICMLNLYINYNQQSIL